MDFRRSAKTNKPVEIGPRQLVAALPYQILTPLVEWAT